MCQQANSLSFGPTREAWKKRLSRFLNRNLLSCPVLAQDLGDLRTIPWSEAKQVSGAPLYPLPTATQAFFCATMHAFSAQCTPYSSEYLRKGATTPSSFATMGAFLSLPRPSLFPAGSPQASFFFFFVDTFNKTAQRCHDSLLKTKVSVMRRGIKAKATPTLAWYEATRGWNSNAHLRKLLFWQLDYWRVIRPQFKRDYRHSHTHRKTYKTFESQVDSSESYLSGSAVLCCKFPQVSPVCSLLFSCKLVVFSQRDVPCQGLRPRRCGLVLYSASVRWQMGSLLSSRAMQRAVQTWV